MKIITWNLMNLGPDRFNNVQKFKFGNTFLNYQLGNNVLDYITGFVLFTPRWQGLDIEITDSPADIFVVIELKTNAGGFGAATNSENTTDALNQLTNAMNIWIAANGDINQYQYQFLPTLITGNKETVGIIYNMRAVTPVGAPSVYNNTHTHDWILPRSPYGVEFTELANGETFHLVGIHAEPTGGGGDLHYKGPIDFCRELQYTLPADAPPTFFVGDFNCHPGRFYKEGEGDPEIYPFVELYNKGFSSDIPDGTLSSLKQKYNQAGYLNEAYDNAIMHPDPANPPVARVYDLIGKARNMGAPGNPPIAPANLKSVFNAYRKNISDHLPVVLEW